MGKQTKILKTILTHFENLNSETLKKWHSTTYNKNIIKMYFKKSLNKSDLVRRILNDVVLSNDEIIELLRIIFNKEK